MLLSGPQFPYPQDGEDHICFLRLVCKAPGIWERLGKWLFHHSIPADSFWRTRERRTCTLRGPGTDWVWCPSSKENPGVWWASCFSFPKSLPLLASCSSYHPGVISKLPVSMLALAVQKQSSEAYLGIANGHKKSTWPWPTFGNQRAPEDMQLTVWFKQRNPLSPFLLNLFYLQNGICNCLIITFMGRCFCTRLPTLMH